MADVLTPDQRRLNMSRIRGRDTKPELLLRRGLHARGLRFRLHHKNLPGRPDLVLARYNAVIFVHGCFWHGHKCPMFKLPTTRAEFWHGKIEQNRRRDLSAHASLAHSGWRILTIWECALKGPRRLPLEGVLDEILRWLRSDEPEGVIEGI